MATYGYCRVSTDRQADEGLSLDVQRRQIEGYCQVLGITLDEVFTERAISGSRPLAERPEGARLMGRLTRGDVLIAAKLDRLFRSALDALQAGEALKQRGVVLHLIDLGGDITNGMGKAFFTIAAAFAEAERDRIRERICDVKRDQHARGRYLGGTVPLGFQVGPDGALVEDPAQQEAIRTIRTLRVGGMSLRAIAAAVETRHGIRISHQGVANALASRRGLQPVANGADAGMIRPTMLVLTLAAPAAAGDLTVLDDRRRPVETISPGIGDHLVRQDPSGARVGTIEQGIGDRLLILDNDQRRQGTVEQGIGDRLYIRDPAGRITGTVEQGIGGRLVIKDAAGRRVGTVER